MVIEGVERFRLLYILLTYLDWQFVFNHLHYTLVLIFDDFIYNIRYELLKYGMGWIMT